MAKKEAASTAMLVLALLKQGEMYGYQIIEELDRRSEHVFQMKEGTLYPVLHGLEKDRLVTAREAVTDKGRTRRYYAVTEKGPVGFGGEGAGVADLLQGGDGHPGRSVRRP